MDELSPTGPKIHPERNQGEAFAKFFEKHKHTDVALALLDSEMPSLVLSSNLSNAVEMHRSGMPIEKAVAKECENICERYMPHFRMLPNSHRVSEMFIERLLKKKIDFSWSRVVLYEYKHTYGPNDDSVTREYLDRFMQLFVNMIDADQAFIDEERTLAEFIEGKGT